MRRSFLIFIYVFLINKTNCCPNGDCCLQGIEDIHWLTAYTNDPVDDFEETEFKRFVVNNVDDVEVEGPDYGKYFEAKLTGEYFIISPTQFFKYFEINEGSTLNPEMNVRFNFKCKKGTRQLSFYQPIRDHNTYDPEFGQSSYTYILPMPLPGKFDVSVFGETIIACDLDISNVRLDFAVNPAVDFSLFWDGPINDTNKCHKAILKTNNPLRLMSDNVYQIMVMDTGIPSRRKIARLEVYVSENTTLPPNPQFESAYYTASYNFENDKNIVVDNPIRLKNGCSKIELDLLEYRDNIQVSCDSDEIIVKLVSTPSDGRWENMVVLLVTIVATLEHAETPGKTVLVINLPKRECPEISTTACPYLIPTIESPLCPTQQASCTCTPCNAETSFISTECPPCSTSPPVECKASSACSPCTTNEEPQSAALIKFKQNSYSFEVESSYQGFVGIVTANAIPEELINYSFEEGEAFMKIDKNTGTVKILTKMNIGTYRFIVHAEGIQSKIRIQTNITINVLKNIDRLETMDSLLVTHVVENERRFITFPCQCDYCSYTIIEQFPETNPKLFGVYNKTQIYAVPIDREMDEIINMKIPQFMLRLVLTETVDCHMHISNNIVLKPKSLYQKEILREWAFIPDKVSYAPDQILTSIIIDDANDNPPVFEEGVKLVIGYPVKSLARIIAPLYLTKVTATDLDAGENAQIRYSTDSSHFLIHPVTGVIYSGDVTVGDDSHNLTFNVIATDRNGSDYGLSANLIVEVKALTQNHLIVLTVKNMALTLELIGLLEKLSNQTNMQIKYLHGASIPVAYTEGSSGSFARIIVYGLNSKYEPVEAHVLENAIEESKESKNVTADKLNVVNLSACGSSQTNLNKAHLIATVVILSILLVIFINVSGAFYYFKVFSAKKTRSCAAAGATD